MDITLGKIVSYVVGIPLVLVSLLLTIQSFLGLVPLVLGLLILPPIRRLIASRAGINFSRGATIGIGTFAIIAAVAVLLVVALSGGGGGSIPGADVSNVSVSAQDASPPDASQSLEIRWNSRAQSAVDLDAEDLSTYRSNDGEKFVVVRMEITNTGDNQIELTPRLLRLESNGVVYDYQGLFGSGNSLSSVSLNPGASYSGLTVFSVPEDTSSAQLQVNQEAYFDQNVSVSFTEDTDLAMNVSD
ncbi:MULTISPECIES: DUF4352 domain-containing protein [unclassified Halorubrum]|uniref:DUF4352 domain-containing protein n=1 Tax=unclassified Halorubrum TaxID=2642239 RepID=UPI0010F9987C|nr:MULTISPECIES: DUF4352 domain-containing protein [unclassified Halorubrum]TKX40736.1 DUF4352 domain-containing protein [Halorubrum sp. CGM4_25_10-8A]TKX67172.1 DUF4352 domain-containing protein [Halorubrum sp. GN12_10-3_MGM]